MSNRHYLYDHSPAGRARHKRYERTAKARERYRRYHSTDEYRDFHKFQMRSSRRKLHIQARAL